MLTAAISIHCYHCSHCYQTVRCISLNLRSVWFRIFGSWSVSNKQTTIKVRWYSSSISEIHKRCMIFWSSCHFKKKKKKDFLRVFFFQDFSLMKTQLLKLQAVGCLRQPSISKYGAWSDFYYSCYLKTYFHELINY